MLDNRPKMPNFIVFWGNDIQGYRIHSKVHEVIRRDVIPESNEHTAGVSGGLPSEAAMPLLCDVLNSRS